MATFEEYRKKREMTPEYQAVVQDMQALFDLADQMLALRLARGWSQAELARRVGTRQANISRLEAGLGNPTLNLLKRLAKAFDVQLSIHLGTPEQVAAAAQSVTASAEQAGPEREWAADVAATSLAG